MKKKNIVGCLIALALSIALALTAIFAFMYLATRVPPHKDDPVLRGQLEKTYQDYLTAIDREDPLLLMSVITAKRMKEYDEVLKENHLGAFPNDYFKVFKPLMPRLPPVQNLRYVALTQNNNIANLIYVGRIKGFLRKTTDEMYFFIVQFINENGKWKYLVCTDQPASMVPHLEERLAKGQLYFLKIKPFKAEEITLAPQK